MTDEKLKPCPFCGGVAAFWSKRQRADWSNTALVECAYCEAYIVRATDDEAIAAWNRRAPFTIEPEMVEVVRKAVKDEIGSRTCHLAEDYRRICSEDAGYSQCTCREVARAAIEALLKEIGKG